MLRGSKSFCQQSINATVCGSPVIACTCGDRTLAVQVRAGELSTNGPWVIGFCEGVPGVERNQGGEHAPKYTLEQSVRLISRPGAQLWFLATLQRVRLPWHLHDRPSSRYVIYLHTYYTFIHAYIHRFILIFIHSYSLLSLLSGFFTDNWAVWCVSGQKYPNSGQCYTVWPVNIQNLNTLHTQLETSVGRRMENQIADKPKENPLHIRAAIH